jgi:hypothetical protein
LLLAIAITPAAFGLLFALLVPILFFCALLVSQPLPIEYEPTPRFFLFFSSASLRAPPVR